MEYWMGISYRFVISAGLLLLGLVAAVPASACLFNNGHFDDSAFLYIAPDFTATQGVPIFATGNTPDVNGVTPLTLAIPDHQVTEVHINWGDGSRKLWQHAENLGTGASGSIISDYTGTPIVPHLNGCYGSLVPCVITDRHVYANPGIYQINITTQKRGTVENYCTHPIKVTVVPAIETFNILSVGDSIASGEGVPTWPATWTIFPLFLFLPLVPPFVLPVPNDLAVWERRFDLTENQTEAHRSYYAGPSVAAEMLQRTFPGLAVNFWHKAWSGATIRGPGRNAESMINDAGAHPLEPKTYDIVLISAGSNDLAVSTRIQHNCYGGLCDQDAVLREAIIADLETLSGKYANLNTAIIKADSATEDAAVFITEYSDFRGGDPNFDCEGGPFGFNRFEAEFIWRDLFSEVNKKIKDAAATHRWHVVPVDFTGHGMCGLRDSQGNVVNSTLPNQDRWVERLFDTIVTQADFSGFYHPNYAGHQHYAQQIYNALYPLALAKTDPIPPTITFLGQMPPANAAGWNNTDVTLTWSCEDAGSGPVNTTVTRVATGEGANLSVTGRCEDKRGNVADDTRTVNIDRTAPSIAITTPAQGAFPVLKSVVAAAYSCADGLSGIEACSGTVPNGSNIDTSSIGVKRFTVDADDRADNMATKTVGYEVIYDVCRPKHHGKKEDHDKEGNKEDHEEDHDKKWNVGKHEVHVTLQLCDAAGANRSIREIVLTATQVVRLSDGAIFPVKRKGHEKSGLRFRYERGHGMYVFDLDTKHYRPGLYRLSFSVSGSTPPYFVEFTVLHRHHTHEDTEEDDHGRGTGPRK